MVSRSRISGARRKTPSGLEDVLEIVSLEIMMTSVRAGTESKSWRERELQILGAATL